MVDEQSPKNVFYILYIHKKKPLLLALYILKFFFQNKECLDEIINSHVKVANIQKKLRAARKVGIF